ncbi:MAG: glycosyltransferase family 39 protein [Acidobacteriota bacterium]|nr:MAG: glycosyltransferase family 39 protein [Acidobacteriota bacterium]
MAAALGPPALIALIFVVLLQLTWSKWPDVWIDFGRELYVPWRLTRGDLLYSEISYFNGPLSPWFNASIFRLFGVSFLSLAITNAVIGLLICLLLYRLGWQMTSRRGGLVIALVFVFLFAFAQYGDNGNYNFLSPYSHEMTHATALSLACLALLGRHMRRPRPSFITVIGVLLGLVFLTKAEFFVALFPAVALGLALHARSVHTAAQTLWHHGSMLLAGMIAPGVVTIGFLSPRLGLTDAVRGTLGPWLYLHQPELSKLRFYREVMGTLDLGESISAMAAWLGLWALLLVPLSVLALASSRNARSRSLLRAGVALVAGWLVFASRDVLDWRNVARPLPLLVALTGVFLFSRWRKRRPASESTSLILQLSSVLFAGLLMLKIILRVRFLHYGFALAMPAMLMVVLVLLEGVPRVIEQRGRCGWTFRAGVLGALLATLVIYAGVSAPAYHARTVRVGSGADTIVAGARGAFMNEVIARLEALAPADATLAVLPEGVLINYLTRRVNPTPFFNFMPPEFIMFGEDRIVEAFRSSPPDFIIMTNRGAFEYGFKLMGRGYGEKLAHWMEQSYTLREQLKDRTRPNDYFSFALILERTDRVVAASNTHQATR